jgi:uncharacterized membrane protein
MRQEGEETVVDVATDFTITGRLARFGRGGMIEDISKRMMRDFSQCLQATLAAEQAAPAAARARDARRGGRRRRGLRAAVPRPGRPPRTEARAAAPPRPARRPPQAKPMHGISLVLSVLWERIERFFASRGEK